MLVSYALLYFSFNCNASFVCTFTILFFFGLFFISFLRLYFAHLKEILLLDCCGSISRHFRVLFHWIVTLASRRRLGSFFHLIVMLVPWALLGFFSIGLLRSYLAHIKDSLLSDCYVSIARTFTRLFHLVVT